MVNEIVGRELSRPIAPTSAALPVVAQPPAPPGPKRKQPHPVKQEQSKNATAAGVDANRIDLVKRSRLSVDDTSPGSEGPNKPTLVPVPAPADLFNMPLLWDKPCEDHRHTVVTDHFDSDGQCVYEGWHGSWGERHQPCWNPPDAGTPVENMNAFLQGGRNAKNAPGVPKDNGRLGLPMVRRNGATRWRAYARVGQGWYKFTFSCHHPLEQPPYLCAQLAAMDHILKRRVFASTEEVGAVLHRVKEALFPLPKMAKNKAGWAHVRTNGAGKWRVYKYFGRTQLMVQCKAFPLVLRNKLEAAVAGAKITTHKELRQVINNILPALQELRRNKTLKLNECNHYWAGEWTQELIDLGFHFCGAIIPPDIVLGMHKIHQKMFPNRNHGFSVKTKDGTGPRSKFLNLPDRLTETFNRPAPPNPKKILPHDRGYETITDTQEVDLVKSFLQVVEDYIGRPRTYITMLDMLYEYYSPGKLPPEWHQDMCTQSIGILCNFGHPIAGACACARVCVRVHVRVCVCVCMCV